MGDAQRLRIFHVFRAPVGGLFRNVSDLASEQTRAGHAVGIVCDSSTGGAFEQQTLSALGEKLELGLIRIPMRRQISLGDFSAARRVLGHLGKLQPDVIHGHGAKGGFYGRLIGTWLGRRRPLARIYTLHGGSMHYDPGTRAGFVFINAERLLERITDGIIHVSEYEAETYRRKVGKPRCPAKVIVNGLHPREFDLVRPRPDARDLLFLGAFREVKGIDVLLEAICKLESTAALRVSANLVGQPDGRAKYVELAERLGLAGRVAFHDPMPIRDALATARAIAVPSRAESLPYVVLEAIAAGVPIIASNVGGIPEIFGPRASELVPPGNSGDLAAALQSMLLDYPRAQQDAAARREWIRPRFNVETMQRQVEALYVEALADKAKLPR